MIEGEISQRAGDCFITGSEGCGSDSEPRIHDEKDIWVVTDEDLYQQMEEMDLSLTIKKAIKEAHSAYQERKVKELKILSTLLQPGLPVSVSDCECLGVSDPAYTVLQLERTGVKIKLFTRNGQQYLQRFNSGGQGEY